MKDRRGSASVTWGQARPRWNSRRERRDCLGRQSQNKRGIKFVVWTIASVAMIYFVIHSYTSG